MKALLPILRNHDHTTVLGFVEFSINRNNRLFVTFDKPVSREAFFEMFGAGARFTDHELSEGTIMVREAELLEFSLFEVRK